MYFNDKIGYPNKYNGLLLLVIILQKKKTSQMRYLIN
jgi:hypothetical protein